VKDQKNIIDVRSFAAGFVIAAIFFMVSILLMHNGYSITGNVGDYGYDDYFSSSSEEYYPQAPEEDYSLQVAEEGYSPQTPEDGYFPPYSEDSYESSGPSSTSDIDCNNDGVPDDRCDYVCWVDINNDGFPDDPC